MTIDTSIYSNLLRSPKSIQEYDNEAMQASKNKLDLSLSQQKADEYARSNQDANKLRDIVSGFGSDTSANQLALLKGGRLKEANEYGKSNADLAETASKTAHSQSQAQKEQFDILQKANGMVGSAAGSLLQNPTYESAVAHVNDLKMKLGPDLSAKLGLDSFQIPQDPQAIQQWAQSHYTQSIDTDKQLADARAKTEGLANRSNQLTMNSATNATSRANTADNNATSRANTAATNATSSANAILSAGKAPTEFQGKSASFGSRAEQADKIISELGTDYSPAKINAKNAISKTWGIGGALEAGANKFAMTENDQKAEQAQRDFVNAVLRQESGAAIGPSEFENAKKQYFPQPGDKQPVLEQKSRNRKLAIQGFMNSSGKAAFHAPEESSIPSGWSVKEH